MRFILTVYRDIVFITCNIVNNNSNSGITNITWNKAPIRKKKTKVVYSEQSLGLPKSFLSGCIPIFNRKLRLLNLFYE